jgi:trans-aconitate 2-methyltransferase
MPRSASTSIRRRFSSSRRVISKRRECTRTKTWSAAQYLKFEDERNRPARDLLAQVPLTGARHIVDLGCGPGNSTELLTERFPEARILGIDSSDDMVRAARQRLPRCEFIESDVGSWVPAEPVDLFFANALFQWMPDHPAIMKRLIGFLPEGGVLAVQMPDNTREPSHLALKELSRGHLPDPETYYDMLRPVCSRIDIWHTVYNHVLDGPEAIVEWFKGSALRPILKTLSSAQAEEFLKDYTAEIASHYARRFDGRVLLRFPRLFLVAVK